MSVCAVPVPGGVQVVAATGVRLPVLLLLAPIWVGVSARFHTCRLLSMPA